MPTTLMALSCMLFFMGHRPRPRSVSEEALHRSPVLSPAARGASSGDPPDDLFDRRRASGGQDQHRPLRGWTRRVVTPSGMSTARQPVACMVQQVEDVKLFAWIIRVVVADRYYVMRRMGTHTGVP